MSLIDRLRKLVALPEAKRRPRIGLPLERSIESRVRQAERKVFRVEVPQRTKFLSAVVRGEPGDNLELSLYFPSEDRKKERLFYPHTAIASEGAYSPLPAAGTWIVIVEGRKVRKGHGKFSLSLVVSGQSLVQGNYVVEFDDRWAMQHTPHLLIPKPEMDYWKSHRNHRPTWFYRIVVDKRKRRFCAQYIAHWPDQYDWIPPWKHKWDYEPVFMYFDFPEGRVWDRIKSSARLSYLYHDYEHWLSRKLHRPFVADDGHPILLLRAGFHAYEFVRPLSTIAHVEDRRNLFEHPALAPPSRMTDKVILDWRSRNENPFTMWNDLIDPWSSDDGPGYKFD